MSSSAFDTALSKASADRERGNAYYREGHVEQAAAMYADGIATLRQAAPSVSGTPVAIRVAFTPLLLNRAQCLLKLGRESEAAADCEEALAFDPANLKALFRAATASEVRLHAEHTC